MTNPTNTAPTAKQLREIAKTCTHPTCINLDDCKVCTVCTKVIR
jgi:hypothetical protein